MSTQINFLAMSHVDLKMGVSSVDLEYRQLLCRFFKAFDGRVSGVKLNFECQCQTKFWPKCRMSDGKMGKCRVSK